MIVLLFLAVTVASGQYVSTSLVKPMPAPLQFTTCALEPGIVWPVAINDTLAHILLLNATNEEEVAPRLSLQGIMQWKTTTNKKCLLTTVSSDAVIGAFELRGRRRSSVRLRVHLPVFIQTGNTGTMTLANDATTTTFTLTKGLPTPATATTAAAWTLRVEWWWLLLLAAWA